MAARAEKFKKLDKKPDSSEEGVYYLRSDPKERGGAAKIAPSAHPTTPWSMGLGWGGEWG